MTVGEVLAERCFPDQVGISGWVARCYCGRIATRRSKDVIRIARSMQCDRKSPEKP